MSGGYSSVSVSLATSVGSGYGIVAVVHDGAFVMTKTDGGRSSPPL